MHSSEPQETGLRQLIQQAIKVPNVTQDSDGRPYGPVCVTIGNVDLSGYVLAGVFYVQAPLSLIFEAFAEDLSEFVSDMEIRISAARRASFSPARLRAAVYRARMARARMVRGGGQQ